MDPAVIGSCRIGHFRIGVIDPIFDQIIGELTYYTPIQSAEAEETPYEYPLAVFDETDFDFCVF